jgi:hypothetical protein
VSSLYFLVVRCKYNSPLPLPRFCFLFGCGENVDLLNRFEVCPYIREGKEKERARKQIYIRDDEKTARKD